MGGRTFGALSLISICDYGIDDLGPLENLLGVFYAYLWLRVRGVCWDKSWLRIALGYLSNRLCVFLGRSRGQFTGIFLSTYLERVFADNVNIGRDVWIEIHNDREQRVVKEKNFFVLDGHVTLCQIFGKYSIDATN